MDSLRHAYDVRVVKPQLFICAFSLFQGAALTRLASVFTFNAGGGCWGLFDGDFDGWKMWEIALLDTFSGDSAVHVLP